MQNPSGNPPQNPYDLSRYDLDDILGTIDEEVRAQLGEGKVAQYIPSLAKVPLERFGNAGHHRRGCDPDQLADDDRRHLRRCRRLRVPCRVAGQERRGRRHRGCGAACHGRMRLVSRIGREGKFGVGRYALHRFTRITGLSVF